MNYKISFNQYGGKRYFDGFTYDGLILGSPIGVCINQYRARQIKKMLEARDGITDVHVVKCQSDGKEENKHALDWINYFNNKSVNEFYQIII